MSSTTIHHPPGTYAERGFGDVGRQRTLGTFISKFIATLAMIVALFGGALMFAAPSEAATSRCGSGTCTVYLTKSETVALSNGKVPNINLGALTVPYRVLAYGHVAIAKGWVARGNCVGFTVSIKPWATQGMFGYRC